MHFLGKQPSSGAVKIAPNKEQAKELNIKKNWKTKSTFIFLDNIWSVDLDDMQLLSKFNKGIYFLLCDIDFFSKYAWVVPDKYGYSDYGIGFDARSQFLGVSNNSSAHVDKKNDILIPNILLIMQSLGKDLCFVCISTVSAYITTSTVFRCFKTIKRYVNTFYVNYNTINTSNILSIYNV